MSLYRTTSTAGLILRRGLFHFRFAPLTKGPRSYGVECAVAPRTTIYYSHFYPYYLF